MLASGRSPRLLLALTGFLTFTAFLLFLLVTLSGPTISSINFTDLSSDDTATTLSTGVFGVCFRLGEGSVFSTDGWASGNPANPTPNVRNRCPQLGLGWNARFSPAYLEMETQPVAPSAFARALVLNVITAAFAGATAMVAAVSLCQPTKVSVLITLATLGITTLFGIAAFGVDIGFSVRTARHLEDMWSAWHVRLGNANWLALGGAISLILALITAGLAYFQIKHTRVREHRSSEVGLRKDSAVESSFDMRRA